MPLKWAAPWVSKFLVFSALLVASDLPPEASPQGQIQTLGVRIGGSKMKKMIVINGGQSLADALNQRGVIAKLGKNGVVVELPKEKRDHAVPIRRK